MTTKICKKCGLEKILTDFRSRRINGKVYYYNMCQLCYNSYQKSYKKENNKIIKEYYDANKEHLKSYRKIYMSERRKNSINFKLNGNISRLIAQVLNNSNSGKRGQSYSKYLLYTIQQLKDHLENQFEFWMSWENYGKYDPKNWNDSDINTWFWNIDHIIPQADLPYSSMEDDNFKQCWALKNLRPLSAKQNWLDGIKRIRHKRMN